MQRHTSRSAICHGFASKCVFDLSSLHLASLCIPFQVSHKQLKARSAKLFGCSVKGGSNPRGDATAEFFLLAETYGFDVSD